MIVADEILKFLQGLKDSSCEVRLAGSQILLKLVEHSKSGAIPKFEVC